MKVNVVVECMGRARVHSACKFFCEQLDENLENEVLILLTRMEANT